MFGRKTFSLDKRISFPDLKTQTINGKRHYVTEDGAFAYPSVTTVLDHSADKTHLYEWRKRVGEEEANRISKRATGRGTAMHNLCEKYVLGEEMDFSSEMPTTTMLFHQMKNFLDRHVDDVYCLEDVLISHKLKVAGRVDLVAEHDGEITIIDFKTSEKTKKKDWITDYFEQASLYGFMFWEMTGIPIKKIVIGIAVADSLEPQVFIESPARYIENVAAKVKKYHKDMA